MGYLLKITNRRDKDSNRVVLKKGMNVELICGSSNSITTREMEQICDMFRNKYNTKCENGFLLMSDIDIEKVS